MGMSCGCRTYAIRAIQVGRGLHIVAWVAPLVKRLLNYDCMLDDNAEAAFSRSFGLPSPTSGLERHA